MASYCFLMSYESNDACRDFGHTARSFWLHCNQIFLERDDVMPRTFPVGDLLFLLLLFRSLIEVQIIERSQLMRRLFGLKAGY